MNLSPTTHDVFISYSSRDKTWVDGICAILERNGVRCWIAPRDIVPGEEWGAAIVRGINCCSIMVLVFSSHANASPQVRREVERAINRNMHLLPMRVEDVYPTESMEYALGNTHWLDAYTPPIEEKLEALATAVKALLLHARVRSNQVGQIPKSTRIPEPPLQSPHESPQTPLPTLVSQPISTTTRLPRALAPPQSIRSAGSRLKWLVLMLVALGGFGVYARNYLWKSGHLESLAHSEVNAANAQKSDAAASTVASERPTETTQLKIVVTAPEYDDMGLFLTSLGSGFRYSTIEFEKLTDGDSLRDVDVLFFTCGTIPHSWAKFDSKGVVVDTNLYNRVVGNLRSFVDRGGTLYSSDLRYHFIAAAFPEKTVGIPTVILKRTIEVTPESGNSLTVDADVLENGLIASIGERVSLQFEHPGWQPAAFSEDKVSVLLRGQFEGMDGKMYRSPLLVRFKVGEGTVLYTSLHHQKTNSGVAAKLLQYLVFTAVLAKVEDQSRQIHRSDGFVAKGKSLLSISTADASITQAYLCTEEGPLQFVLGFDDRDARIKLTIISPGGTIYKGEGRSTFHVDISNAAIGEWRYTVAASKLPYDNFPCSVSIGAK